MLAGETPVTTAASAFQERTSAITSISTQEPNGICVTPKALRAWAPAQWPVSLDPSEHNRRSVYLYVKRSFPYPMLAIFDEPESSVSCPRRDVTTVAPQALALFNSQFDRIVELAARHHVPTIYNGASMPCGGGARLGDFICLSVP